jgi:glycine oxidase
VVDAPICIIGAGTIGLGIAWRLANRGHDVCVFERGRPGAGASRAAAGMLAPTAEVKFGEGALLRLQQQSLERFGDFVRELEAQTGLDVDYRDEGTLIVALEPDDTGRLDRTLAYQLELGLNARRLTGAEARELEPRLAPTVHSAVHCPKDHQVDAWKLVEATAPGPLERRGVVAGDRARPPRHLVERNLCRRDVSGGRGGQDARRLRGVFARTIC